MLVEACQAELPSFPLNLYNAIKRDYVDESAPSTRIFARAWIFGYLSETVPSSLSILLKLALTIKRGRLSGVTLRKALQSWRKILKAGFGKHGLAFFFATGLALGNWLDGKLYPLLCRIWLRVARRLSKSRKTNLPTDDAVRLDSRTRKHIQYTSTFLATLLSSALAFNLQSRGPKSSSSKLPLVSFTDTPGVDHVKNTLQSPSIPYEGSTLNFTLFLLVQGLDSALRGIYTQANLSRYALGRLLASRGDVILFILSSWRIMWVWFYKPWLLPPSYNR